MSKFIHPKVVFSSGAQSLRTSSNLALIYAAVHLKKKKKFYLGGTPHLFIFL